MQPGEGQIAFGLPAGDRQHAVLVVQGDRDRIMPPDATGARLPDLIRDAGYVAVPDGPHAIIWTHADQVNSALLDFLGAL